GKYQLHVLLGVGRPFFWDVLRTLKVHNFLTRGTSQARTIHIVRGANREIDLSINLIVVALLVDAMYCGAHHAPEMKEDAGLHNQVVEGRERSFRNSEHFFMSSISPISSIRAFTCRNLFKSSGC